MSNRKQYNLKWAEEAGRDLGRLHRFLKKENPKAALHALKRIKECSQMLQSYPEIGIKYDGGHQRELVASFGANAYILRYRIEKDGNILIIRVWHSRETRH